MEGWIKSYRGMLENPIICKDADHYAVWGYLMHYAAHNKFDVLFDGKRITLFPGQLITGRKKIADHFGINESKVVRILKLFKIEQQIEQQTCSKSSLISILNWHKFQGSEQQHEQQLNNNRTTTEQQLNTIQECNNEIIEECDNSTHTQNDFSVNTKTRAREALEWITSNYPDVQKMDSPFSEQHAEWLVCKYDIEDIRRIIIDMDNKDATKNKNAYATFCSFAARDSILKDRRQKGEKLYTYEEVCTEVTKGLTFAHFVQTDQKSPNNNKGLWRKK